MLTVETARKIGLNACVDKLGRDFVLKHQHLATAAYGEIEDHVFCFVGIDCKQKNNHNGQLVLDSISKFSHQTSCKISLMDGAVTFME
jgi:hypothetical protein